MTRGLRPLPVAAAALAAAVLAGCARGQPTVTPLPRPAAAAAADQDTAGPARPAAPQQPPQPRPYSRVITADAVTTTGLFKTHRVGERLYFEIPRAALGAELLILRRVAAGSGSPGTMVGVFEREGNRVLLRRRTYEFTADPSSRIARAVDAMRVGDIVAAFNIEAIGPDGAPVIDVTRLFTTNIPEFAGVNSPTADRSFVEWVRAFPENVAVEATQTGQQPPPAAGAGQQPQAQQQPRGAQTARLHWSFRRLPETPMMPRLHDRRVGYITVSTIDYSRPEHRAEQRTYIRRFRLEKQDPGAAVSRPVRPIEFWIDPATPEWLVPWVRRGIEAWQPAYEAAGFREAIVARDAPTPEEDPDWSPYDARHSIIYWRPSTVQNATGGQQVDPRTGEILKAEVNMFHNVMNLLRNWYFVQVSPLDPRARTLPLPDSLMGRLVEYVVAHEVGHAIGFPHNFKASAMYPADSLRSASFLRRMRGHVATLMDYSRFNYVAQPEDAIPPELLVPQVGPYDVFAVQWGHTPIPGARTPDDELPTLDRWARQQDTIPWFRFTTADAPNDPHAVTEAVGNADAIKSSGLGMKNLERVAASLLEVAERPGQDYSLLNELYGNVVQQWGRYNGHVVALIGGAYTQERYGTGPRFDPVPRDEQRAAMRYLAENAFRVPAFLLDPQVLRRIEAAGVVGRIRQAQAGVLNQLFSEARLGRLIEYEAIEGASRTYTLADLLAEARRGVWTELDGGNVRIDVYRRNLQRAYLEALERVLDPPAAPATPTPFGAPQPPRFVTDARPAVRGHLAELDRQVATALGRTNDAMTRLHLQDVRMEIERLLDNRRR
jgi:hypothetical protein